MLKCWPALTVSDWKRIGVLSVLKKSCYKNKELTSFRPPDIENTTSCFNSEIIPQAFLDGMKVAHFVTISGKLLLMPSITRAFHLGNDALCWALVLVKKKIDIKFSDLICKNTVEDEALKSPLFSPKKISDDLRHLTT